MCVEGFMKVSRMKQLSLYVGFALVFGSTISAPSVWAADAGDSHTIVVYRKPPDSPGVQ